jgi:hypothetical protein
MADKFWEADEVEGQFMEVIISGDDELEYVYWVALEKLPEAEDEYDWAIAIAVAHHNEAKAANATEDDAEAAEPFSRYESEFEFVY